MRGFDSYLTFQKLEVFCTVVELGSVTRAADRLCIAQPVVTAHVRSMEARLGYALVRRSGRNIALTEAGERIYRWATEVITRTREVERELAGLESGEMGNAVVATSMSVGSYALPPLLLDFHRLHPDGLVTVEISNPQGAVDATRMGTCDFAVILLAVGQDLDGLTTLPLWEDDLVLVCSPSNGQLAAGRSRCAPDAFRQHATQYAASRIGGVTAASTGFRAAASGHRARPSGGHEACGATGSRRELHVRLSGARRDCPW